jgi:hypothetical protein
MVHDPVLLAQLSHESLSKKGIGKGLGVGFLEKQARSKCKGKQA